MARTGPVIEVRVADAPRVRQILESVANLLRALALCADLPDAVMSAADEIRLAVAALGGEDIGPPPESDEVRIRTAMNVATENPGRVVTVE
jgi:hypothetical protein